MHTGKKQVALLGPQNSFHHVAAISKFGDTLSPCFKNEFQEIIHSVVSSESEFGMLAVYNSNAGYVGNNIPFIVESGLHITDEIKLQIHFYLAAKTVFPQNQITSIASHPVGFLQCVEFLKKFSGIHRIETSSTSQAAALVAQTDEDFATALAGKPTIESNGLKILASATPDNEIYTTRFLVLSKTISDKNQSPDSELIISLFGKEEEIKISINGTSIIVANIVKLHGDENSYVELFGKNISDALSYIYKIQSIHQTISLIGYYPKCEIIVNT